MLWMDASDTDHKKEGLSFQDSVFRFPFVVIRCTNLLI